MLASNARACRDFFNQDNDLANFSNISENILFRKNNELNIIYSSEL